MRNVLQIDGLLVFTFLFVQGIPTFAEETKQPPIPHAQDKPPNDPRDPITAAKMMTVPEGFTVEVVAAEPDIINPVAMAIDERGRFWITESLEYPRREPGPGLDRVKILEDTDGDGKADKVTVFMEGLNIPSGIAIGHGGVWIANAPDILFVQDTDGDGKADRQEVVVTGFGRSDTHELPNSLTWGPDGWLYGLNGVFNHSHVKYSTTNPNFHEQHPGWPLTCAMFRIHPRTREFQVFCEGTSNPWGIAFNDEGEAFISACVIDHLWHLVETGYYHRQGGPYPPFTWKIESIVKHKHQKAAYCGIHYFDSDAYPEQYRGKLYMGNIHGGCINVDRIKRDGSTYQAHGEADFLTANDAWFMPVVQKTGPDGCLYILDWYDRYHCYQDANRDPAGIDRLKGRLYRVRYQDSPRTPQGFDLAKESDEQLIERLGAKNDFIRWTATRLLTERATPALRIALAKVAGGNDAKFPQRRHAFFALLAAHHQTNDHGMIRSDLALIPNADGPTDPVLEAWMWRFVGENPVIRKTQADELLDSNEPWFQDWSKELPMAAQVRLQQMIAFLKFPLPRPRLIEGLIYHLAQSGDDTLLPRIIWANLHPYLEDDAVEFVRLVETKNYLKAGPVADILPRVVDRLLGRRNFDAKPIGRLFALIQHAHPQIGRQILEGISSKVQSGELKGDNLMQLKTEMEPELAPMLGVESKHPLRFEASLLALSWGDRGEAVGTARMMILHKDEPPTQRLAAYRALIAAKDGCVAQIAREVLRRKPQESPAFIADFVTALARIDSGKLEREVGDEVVQRFAELPSDLQPKAIELLTQRAGWAKQLLTAIGEKQIAASAINLNQARRLKELKDEELTKLLATHWGQVREGRDPDREKYVADMRQLIRKTPGNPFAGEKAFKKVCAQCHKIYGEGADVGPDITLNGRNDFNQLLSNVFDPSLVIGSGYRSYTVITNGGRVLNGLLAEDSPQRIVLKVQGGKQEVIVREDIDEFKVNEISLMPEQLEKQLTPQEIVDLFAFISLDKHPSDKTARKLAGAGEMIPK